MAAGCAGDIIDPRIAAWETLMRGPGKGHRLVLRVACCCTQASSKGDGSSFGYSVATSMLSMLQRPGPSISRPSEMGERSNESYKGNCLEDNVKRSATKSKIRTVEVSTFEASFVAVSGTRSPASIHLLIHKLSYRRDGDTNTNNAEARR
jgi:hypothetical protein